jgi:hypothetical protein
MSIVFHKFPKYNPLIILNRKIQSCEYFPKSVAERAEAEEYVVNAEKKH